MPSESLKSKVKGSARKLSKKSNKKNSRPFTKDQINKILQANELVSLRKVFAGIKNSHQPPQTTEDMGKQLVNSIKVVSDFKPITVPDQAKQSLDRMYDVFGKITDFEQNNPIEKAWNMLAKSQTILQKLPQGTPGKNPIKQAQIGSQNLTFKKLMKQWKSPPNPGGLEAEVRDVILGSFPPVVTTERNKSNYRNILKSNAETFNKARSIVEDSYWNLSDRAQKLCAALVDLSSNIDEQNKDKEDGVKDAGVFLHNFSEKAKLHNTKLLEIRNLGELGGGLSSEIETLQKIVNQGKSQDIPDLEQQIEQLKVRLQDTVQQATTLSQEVERLNSKLSSSTTKTELKSSVKTVLASIDSAEKIISKAKKLETRAKNIKKKTHQYKSRATTLQIKASEHRTQQNNFTFWSRENKYAENDKSTRDANSSPAIFTIHVSSPFRLDRLEGIMHIQKEFPCIDMDTVKETPGSNFFSRGKVEFEVPGFDNAREVLEFLGKERTGLRVDKVEFRQNENVLSQGNNQSIESQEQTAGRDTTNETIKSPAGRLGGSQEPENHQVQGSSLSIQGMPEGKDTPRTGSTTFTKTKEEPSREQKKQTGVKISQEQGKSISA